MLGRGGGHKVSAASWWRGLWSLNLTLDVSQLSWWGEGIQWPWRCPVAKEC